MNDTAKIVNESIATCWRVIAMACETAMKDHSKRSDALEVIEGQSTCIREFMATVEDDPDA